MGAVAILPPRPAALDPLSDGKILGLIQRMYAPDATTDEFNVFIGLCRSLGLDPRRKQVYHFVYNKNRPDKRKVAIVVGIDGFRASAARTGDYRPDEDEPGFEFDPEAKSPTTNPTGLVKATVRVWKHSHGQWHRVTASAYWDEYAPLKDQWADDPETGKGRKTGKQTLDTSGNWGRMPRVMLAKVAEALALRKAWPEDLSGVHAEEEMERTHVLASDLAEQAETQERQARLGGPGIFIDWLDGSPVEKVAVGKVFDRVAAFVKTVEDRPDADTSLIADWRQQNRAALGEYWAHSKSDALAMRDELDAVAARLTARGRASA